MLAIQENPYRIIGILAGANQREIERQKAKINAFLSVGKKISFDTDFNFLVLPKRDNTSVSTAFANIQLNQGRLFNSLFWFVNGSHLDEPAFNYLKEGNTAKAIEIWSKTSSSGEVTGRNFSSYNNLGTLKLALAFSNGVLDKDSLAGGIEYKLKLLKSACFYDFVQKVADETFKPDSEEQAKKFIDGVLEHLNPYIDTPNGISTTNLLSLFSNVSTSSHEYLVQKFIEKPLHSIEDKIVSAKRNRNANPEVAIRTGTGLYMGTKEDLGILKSLIGLSNIRYKSVADKLATELMQCGIDYFQEKEDSSQTNLGPEIMTLFGFARSIAEGNQTKARIKENIEGLQSWIDEKPERDKQERVGEDFKFITTQLEKFQNQYSSVENAKTFVFSCKPRIKNIKTELGAYDELYLSVSTAVVNNAMGMLVDIVNTKQKTLTPGNLLTTINDVVDLMNSLSAVDMVPKARESFNKNKETVLGIQSQLESIINRSYSSSGSPKKSNSKEKSGCVLPILLIIVCAIFFGALTNGKGVFAGAIAGGVLAYVIKWIRKN